MITAIQNFIANYDSLRPIYRINFLRCHRKVYYRSRAKGRKALRRWDIAGAFDVYHCHLCGGWHLGSRKRPYEPKIKRG